MKRRFCEIIFPVVRRAPIGLHTVRVSNFHINKFTLRPGRNNRASLLYFIHNSFYCFFFSLHTKPNC